MASVTKDLQAAIAVTRFGLGARPGEIDAAKGDPQGWLKAQIRRQGADQPQGDLGSIRENFAALDARQQVIRNGAADPAMRREATAPLREGVIDEMLARARLAATTPAGFRERWTLFWANHFTVAAKALQVAAAVGPFEREAIRPNVFGRFEDLLVASNRHPGMLLYLDQAQSLGPNSQVATRQRRGGLNENLAREIMELHTVGADAGYTQADVTEFARALTGWSIGGQQVPEAQRGAYIYRAAMHEPGERTIMGRRYGTGGEDQARRVLADLAGDRRTARHLARKIAVHFVADDPPAALTARLEAAWTTSGGDLSAVAAALIAAPEAWEPQARKLKTPYEFIVSGYRAASVQPRDGQREVAVALTALGQRPWAAPQPNGWSEMAADWAPPDAIVKRLTWAQAFSNAYAPQGSPAEIADSVLGARLSPVTRQAVSRAETRPEAFAILLMSPEFQRR